MNFFFFILDFDDSMFVRTSTPEEWIAQGEYYAKHQCWKVRGLVGASGSLCDWWPRRASQAGFPPSCFSLGQRRIMVLVLLLLKHQVTPR